MSSLWAQSRNAQHKLLAGCTSSLKAAGRQPTPARLRYVAVYVFVHGFELVNPARAQPTYSKRQHHVPAASGRLHARWWRCQMGGPGGTWALAARPMPTARSSFSGGGPYGGAGDPFVDVLRNSAIFKNEVIVKVQQQCSRALKVPPTRLTS
jgi:hypothetical protein